VLAGVQPVEIGNSVDAEQDRLTIDHEWLDLFRGADSTISGYRFVQSAPLRVNSRTCLPSRGRSTVALIFNLVKPIRPKRNLSCAPAGHRRLGLS
jgi:hypothetical protein